MRRYPDYDRNMEEMIDLLPPEKKGVFPLRRTASRIDSDADVAPFQTAFAAQEAAHQLDDDDRAMALMIVALYTRDAGAVSRFFSLKHNVSYNAVTFPLRVVRSAFRADAWRRDSRKGGLCSCAPRAREAGACPTDRGYGSKPSRDR